MATALDISERTVFRTKWRYAEEGLDEVLRHHNQVNLPRKVNEKVEAHLIALACSLVPDGHGHWTIRALAGKVVELGLVESLSPETVRLRLKKHAQVVAQETMVYPQGRWRGRGGHGGRAGDLRRAPRPAAAGGLLRRDLNPVAGRREGTAAGQAWEAEA